jgi:hypothetical protein
VSNDINTVFGLLALLATCGFVPDRKRVKVVRHKDTRFDVEALKRDGWLDVYQQHQSGPVFDGCDQIVVFIGEDATTARFVGVYDVGARERAVDVPLPPEFPYHDWADSGYFYSLVKRAGFTEFEDRLVIEWGRAALSWHQWCTDREVIELRRRGRALPPFRDYLEVHLSFDSRTLDKRA